MIRARTMIAGALITLQIASCSRKEPVDVVAKVGDAVLTREEAQRGLDTSGAAGDEHLQQGVASWVNRELLYQEARRRGVEESPAFAISLADARKQLAVQSFLEREIFSDSTEIPDSLLVIFYRQHADEFVLRDDLVRLNSVTFRMREQANRFASLVAQGFDWEKALLHFRSEIPAQDVLSSAAGEYCTQRTLFPAELWKAATVLGFSDVSFPIKTPTGWVILQPLSLARQGKTPPFEVVRREVRQRILLERRRENLENLMISLRREYPVQVFLNPPTFTDSLAQHIHE